MKKLIDYILESISNSYLFEMAYDRASYCMELRSLSVQIVQNWCLIKYCNLYDDENYNRLHWSKELSTHLIRLQSVKLKSGDKLRATQQELIVKSELGDPETIFDICNGKWNLERLPKDKLNDVAKEFSKELPNLCKHICDPRFDLVNYSYNGL